MKISRLEIRNALGIKEFEISPDKITIIQGKNESGKTSILESIERALYNRNRRVDFVRKGEKEAALYVELDNGTKIDKKVTSTGDTRSKVIQEGVILAKPESMLKSLVGEFAFNPIDFLRKTDKEQSEILLSLIPMRITEEDLKKWTGEVPLVNLDNHAIKNLEYLAEEYFYDKRTTANAELKDVKNQIESLRAQLPDNYKPEEWEKVDLYSLHEKVREARDHNSNIVDAKLFVDEFEERQKDINRKYDIDKKNRIDLDGARVQEINDEIIRLKNELATIKGQQEEAIRQIEKEREAELLARVNMKTEKEEFLKNNKQIEDLELLSEAKKAEEMKGYLSLAENLKKLEKEEITKEAEAKRLDTVVELLRGKPAELLSKVKLPIKGLGINDKMQVTIDDLPIANLSTSRQIALAIEIARATSGELKLICIDRFETLDEEHRKILLDEISKDGFQYFISEVTEGELKVSKLAS
jgi:exonuclease SbcC